MDDDGEHGGGDDQPGDYEVGYGKPPKHTRWSKGQSGNPRGPAKGSRGLKADLDEALNTKHTIKINGKVYKGRTQKLAMYGLALRAASGDLKAAKLLTDLILAIFGPDDRGGERKTLSAQDEELMARMLQRFEPDEGSGGEVGGADGGPHAPLPLADNAPDDLTNATPLGEQP